MPLEKVTLVDGPFDGQEIEVQNFVDRLAIEHDDGWSYVYRRNMGKFELIGRTDDASQIPEMNPQMAMQRLTDFVTDLSRETDMLRKQITEERAKPKLARGLAIYIEGVKHIIDSFDEDCREIRVVQA